MTDAAREQFCYWLERHIEGASGPSALRGLVAALEAVRNDQTPLPRDTARMARSLTGVTHGTYGAAVAALLQVHVDVSLNFIFATVHGRGFGNPVRSPAAGALPWWRRLGTIGHRRG